MKQSINILLSGGGTGGHIFPAVSIAQELKNRYPDANFLFVGAQNRMEMEKVPQAGFDIKGLWISGLQRKLTLSNLLFPIKIIDSLIKARKIIRQFKPDVAIGTGGFASGPTLFAAASMGIPTLIQEQNSYPGITNKLLAQKVNKICVAYDNLETFFPPNKTIKTGNPVRQDLLDIKNKKQEAYNFFSIIPPKKTLLVLGGSLGARMINTIIDENLNYILENDIQIIWQTGKLYFEDYKKHNAKKDVQTHAFLNRMDLAYTAADFIISRAGAGSISELCIVGKPVLFIPSPNVSEDHQTKNAQAIANDSAAILLKETDKGDFKKVFKLLIESGTTLSENIKKLALPNATSDIADEVIKLIEQKN